MKNKYILSLLVLLNVLLGIKVYLLTEQITKINDEKNNLHLRFYEYEDYSSLLNPVDYKYKIIEYLGKLKANSDFNLIAFFDEKTCPACIISEINYLNDLYSDYSNNIIVCFFGEKFSLLKDLGAKFDYIKLSKREKIFSKKMDYNAPVSFLINRNKEIIDINKTEKGVSIKSRIFYDKVRNIFKLSREQNISGI